MKKYLYREYGLDGRFTDYKMTKLEHTVKSILFMIFLITIMVGSFIIITLFFMK